MTHTPTPPGAGLLSFQGFSVRYLLDEDGSAWLVARDFLSIMNLDVARNPGRWLARTPDADKDFRNVQSVKGPQRSLVISIPGAYALTKRYKKPNGPLVRSFLNREAAPLVHCHDRD